MLDRLDAFDKGTKADDRKATRKEDHAALKVLVERGITVEERTRMRQLVHTASRAPQMDSAAPLPKGEDTMERSLVALHEWLTEWVAVARVAITKRSWLILMGLARRKRNGAAEGTETAAGDA